MTLLDDVDSFFAQEAEDPGWLFPILLILGSGVISSLGVYYMYQFSVQGMGSMTTIPMAIGIAVAVLAIPVMWVVYTLVFYGLSSLFDGDGGFKETMILTGWGFAPAILGSLVGTIAFYYAAQTVPPATSFQELAAVQRQIQNHQYVTWSSAFNLVLTLAQGVLWTYGVKHARDLSLRDAGIVVSLPVLVSVGLTLNSLL
jgi:hypothetical protein